MLTGCANGCARKWGGTENVNLPEGKKLINVSWKDSDLWILTRDMKENEEPETYEYIESSNLGVLEGKVIIKEIKK
ncbi:hypothetical protein D3C81_2031510 [compost metagenome]